LESTAILATEDAGLADNVNCFLKHVHVFDLDDASPADPIHWPCQSAFNGEYAGTAPKHETAWIHNAAITIPGRSLHLSRIFLMFIPPDLLYFLSLEGRGLR
jgi:hypothetical protein